ncbi:hypothetical protein, partial [Oceanobacillus oncorhynchi]|uniref:hypothetical protein n=1 Tax=Oceanobacillus oncorhynchi TaxID=545501 RepID=UPI0034D51D56
KMEERNSSIAEFGNVGREHGGEAVEEDCGGVLGGTLIFYGDKVERMGFEIETLEYIWEEDRI